jgi:hypothetical protein
MSEHDQLTFLPTKKAAKPSAPVDKRYLFGLPNLRRVIRYSASLRDLEAKQVYEPLGKDQAVWSRIEGGTAAFPADQILDLAKICDNHAPLMWLAYKAGYELVPLRSELERENERLKAELAQVNHDREVEREYARQMLKERR